MTGVIKQYWQEVPASVKIFAKRALLLIAGWLLLYQLLLKPAGVPDRWLTHVTATSTVYVLNSWYGHGFAATDGTMLNPVSGSTDKISFITYKNILRLRIADGCNALDLFMLYAGFLLCLPTGAARMTLFGITGVIAIFVLNILRLYALVLLAINLPGWLNFAHHYAFTIIVYCCIFAGWVFYAKSYTPGKMA
ncbi:MAG TPA: exosortase/archaeosortase family protein [Chitinophagaceae bacterium]|nr:exosortase/archaeosortase family protein [Chitinophagaceae bacterium]